MPGLKVLSGKDVIDCLQKFGFEIQKQKGSHVKLGRFKNDEKQTLTIPNHKEIDKGTLKAIYRQALRYIPEDGLREKFYDE